MGPRHLWGFRVTSYLTVAFIALSHLHAKVGQRLHHVAVFLHGPDLVPESAARRNLKPMKLAQIELTDGWRVRERYILVRDLELLPAYARSLIDTLCGHFRAPARL